jgi:hypothetical protein
MKEVYIMLAQLIHILDCGLEYEGQAQEVSDKLYDELQKVEDKLND